MITFTTINLMIGIINAILIKKTEVLMINDYIENKDMYLKEYYGVEVVNKEDIPVLESLKENIKVFLINCIPIINLYQLTIISFTYFTLLNSRNGN